jgi:thiol:disulfide interchange protein DsbD
MNRMRALLTLLFGLLAATAAAQDLLEPEKAFRLSARAIDATTVEVRFDIARGYYMYRDKFAFAAEPADVKLGPAVFPKGEVKKDEFFGLMETYRKQVAVTLPVADRGMGRDPSLPDRAERLTLEVTSQGCADIGVCYPPQVQTVEVKLAALASGGAPAAPPISSAQFGGREVRGEPGIVSDEARFEQALLSGNFLLMLAAFFGAGILLAFTPCVLPMVPILSGIIIGEGRAIAKAHAFALSLTYVLGMALTYTVIGILAALSGTLLSATLQNPWVLGAFAAVFVALAASMFGFYELQLPAVFHSRVAAASQKLKGGEIAGVALMGVLSAAIVSPCVAAPLAGALLYISQTRDVALGGAALFSLALGMGVPLIVVGVTGGALLPKSGHWMKAVKKFFGFMLLGLAIWIVAPVIPAALHMLAWAALLIIGAMYLHALDPLPEHASGYARFWKGVGVIALLAGTALVIGALAGSRDVLQPLAGLRVAEAVGAPGAPGGPAEGVRFERVSTVAELDARLKNVSRPVMLDFYADWCVSCKEMERFTFSDAKVKAELAQMVLLQVDVTKNTPEDQQLLKRYRLFGPPGIIFFDKGGREIPGLRVIGYQPADKFLHSLALARSF